jgi:hypothetical protein
MYKMSTEQYGKMMALKYMGKSHLEISMVTGAPIDQIAYHLGGEKDRVIGGPLLFKKEQLQAN